MPKEITDGRDITLRNSTKVVDPLIDVQFFAAGASAYIGTFMRIIILFL